MLRSIPRIKTAKVLLLSAGDGDVAALFEETEPAGERVKNGNCKSVSIFIIIRDANCSRATVVISFVPQFSKGAFLTAVKHFCG